MLANRADVWNLGDVLTGKKEAFALSFLENALTANPVLAPLAGRDRADLELLVRLATDDPTARADRLDHAYPPAELERILSVLRHLVAPARRCWPSTRPTSPPRPGRTRPVPNPPSGSRAPTAT